MSAISSWEISGTSRFEPSPPMAEPMRVDHSTVLGAGLVSCSRLAASGGWQAQREALERGMAWTMLTETMVSSGWSSAVFQRGGGFVPGDSHTRAMVIEQPFQLRGGVERVVLDHGGTK